jgi:hypothetical protein
MESVDGGMLVSVVKRLAALSLPLALTGCITDGVGSVKGGDCKLFEAPQYAIRGATQHDQDWIDPTIEGGVGGCKWARPAPRPAEWDAKPVAARVAPAVPKKRSLAARVKARIWSGHQTSVIRHQMSVISHQTSVISHLTTAPPVVVVPEAPAPAAPVASPPAPRSRIDELLHPAR